jgi:DNA polymerase I-like protein with 3'-5' exonuclease and polymerase domains
MFIPTPPKVLVGIDSKGNQIRQLAARMGDDEFTAVVLDPSRDIHSFNQARAGIASRHQAKIFFYSLIFGAGNPKIERQLGLPPGGGAALRARFMGGMPKMQALLERLAEEWRANGGWIRGLDGRPISVPNLHQLLVYMLQSDEAIQLSHAYVLFAERGSTLWEHGRDWAIVLWMHDEFQVECVPEIAEEVGQLGSWAIAEAGRQLGIPVPHEGDFKIGRNWNDTH